MKMVIISLGTGFYCVCCCAYDAFVPPLDREANVLQASYYVGGLCLQDFRVPELEA
jgi:hypothetical protein